LIFLNLKGASFTTTTQNLRLTTKSWNVRDGSWVKYICRSSLIIPTSFT